MTMWDGQYSHPSATELQAILARARIDLQRALAGDEAAAQRYRYRGVECVGLSRDVVLTTTAAVSRVSYKAYAPSIHDLVAKGDRTIDWIWRWSAIPLLGPIVMDWFANQLDRLTDRLDTVVKPDTTNSN